MGGLLVNGKGYLKKKKKVVFFEVISQHSLGGTEKVHERPLAEIRPRYVQPTAWQ